MERLTIDEIIAHCERKVERIGKYNNGVNTIETASIDLPIVKEYWEHKQVAEYLKELKAYRDAEEQGLLIKLPCKIGDTLYVISRDKVIPVTASWFIYNQYGIGICAYNEEQWGYGHINLYQNKRCVEWFATKEEAEQKLESMRKE